MEREIASRSSTPGHKIASNQATPCETVATMPYISQDCESHIRAIERSQRQNSKPDRRSQYHELSRECTEDTRELFLN